MRLISKKSVLRSRQTDTFTFAWNVWMYFSYYNTLQEEDFAEHVWMPQLLPDKYFWIKLWFYASLFKRYYLLSFVWVMKVKRCKDKPYQIINSKRNKVSHSKVQLSLVQTKLMRLVAHSVDILSGSWKSRPDTRVMSYLDIIP